MIRRGGVEVTGGFLLLMAWLNYWDTQGLLPAVLAAAAAHELGHWTAVRAVGGRIALLRLSAAGAEIRMEGTLSYGRELLCALAGPLVNLVLAFGAARVGAEVFAGLNLALGLFNLLPLSALDGGKVLGCAVALFLGAEGGGQVQAVIDRVLSLLLVICGAVLLEKGGGVTLLVVAVWLIWAVGEPWSKTWQKKGLSRKR